MGADISDSLLPAPASWVSPSPSSGKVMAVLCGTQRHAHALAEGAGGRLSSGRATLIRTAPLPELEEVVSGKKPSGPRRHTGRGTQRPFVRSFLAGRVEAKAIEVEIRLGCRLRQRAAGVPDPAWVTSGRDSPVPRDARASPRPDLNHQSSPSMNHVPPRCSCDPRPLPTRACPWCPSSCRRPPREVVVDVGACSPWSGAAIPAVADYKGISHHRTSEAPARNPSIGYVYDGGHVEPAPRARVLAGSRDWRSMLVADVPGVVSNAAAVVVAEAVARPAAEADLASFCSRIQPLGVIPVAEEAHQHAVLDAPCARVGRPRTCPRWHTPPSPAAATGLPTHGPGTGARGEERPRLARRHDQVEVPPPAGVGRLHGGLRPPAGGGPLNNLIVPACHAGAFYASSTPFLGRLGSRSPRRGSASTTTARCRGSWARKRHHVRGPAHRPHRPHPGRRAGRAS